MNIVNEEEIEKSPMSDEELISAYVDGRTSEPERAAFEARLQADAALRRQVAVTRLLVDQSRQVESVAAPKNFILPQDFGKSAQPVPPARRFDWRLLFFRFGSVAAAMVFVFAVAFDALRNTTPPATPAAAPMVERATSAAEAAITTNIEPVTATTALEQAPAAGAMMVEATPMMQSRALPSDAMSTMSMSDTISPAVMTEAMPSAASAKAMPMTQTQSVGTQNTGAQNVGTQNAGTQNAGTQQAEPFITPLRVVAGVALLLALLLGALGWRR